jgi:hypothetical protein
MLSETPQKGGYSPGGQQMGTNSKSEARISKQIRMTKIQNLKRPHKGAKGRISSRQPPKQLDSFLSFDHSNFGFFSDFEIRISDLQPPVVSRLKSIRHCIYGPPHHEALLWN